jgi:selenoprotein W-related protein
MSVKVKIEYCSVCDFKKQCDDLRNYVNEKVPEADVKCVTGPRGRTVIFKSVFAQFIKTMQSFPGSFEVQINDTLVHSKLRTLAFPDFQEVALNCQNALEGREVKKVKEQPIKDCVIQ